MLFNQTSFRSLPLSSGDSRIQNQDSGH
jgi:hypothetical protein